ncbi:MAG: hypothetical protein IAE66_04265 [Xanthomonadaceae bacterium]|nr:hypothetical protein [Xanthomonadaceae bacterium]
MKPLDLKALALALAIGATSAPLAAQDISWNPRSGDVWIDQRLGDINSYGMRYRDPFVNEMVRYYGAPRDLVSDLLVQRNWAPGDVYYACSIAHILGIPCRNVVDVWDRDHGQGWGAVAQRMGIKPGSAEFHQLKRGFVPSYDRWGRPIVLDAELERAYPDRGKGKHGASHASGSHGKPAQAGSKAKGHNDNGKAKGNRGKSKNDNGNGKGRG